MLELPGRSNSSTLTTVDVSFTALADELQQKHPSDFHLEGPMVMRSLGFHCVRFRIPEILSEDLEHCNDASFDSRVVC